MPMDKVWLPTLQIDVGAAASPDKVERKRHRVEIESDGGVSVSFHREIKFYCDPIVVDGVTVTHPDQIVCGDEFKCTVPVADWTYLDTQLLLEVGEPGGGMGMNRFSGSSDFAYTIVNTTSFITRERFDCCDGDFHTINYNVWLRKVSPCG